ncbi:alpha-tocopherol transfer protein-like [Ostrinia furnacalis]|uniref:alpha-tocopherol transfer protein-like n=1 Tax=Ostrinia furnacalis TaxID=93504 RepID=UPI00103969E4|nr:alpha-tocopherol transfer protein-like [Ostrinia furnacalis]
MPVELEYDYAAATSAMDTFSQDDINYLKQWTQNLDKSKYVPKDLTDKQLVLFYNACYGDLERTKTCVEKYYSCRKNSPEFFDNRKVNSPEMAPIVEALEFSVLPGKSVEGYDVIYHRLHYTEPSKYNFELGVKLFFMTIDMCLSKRGPQNGLIFLFDMRGVKLGHLARCGLSGFRKFFVYLQEALPVRMRAIHILNTEPVLDKLLLIIKPFMEKKFYDMLNFHHKDEDLESFFETVIPRSVVPQDHGGTLPDTQTLHKKCMQFLQAMEPYFREEEEQRILALPDKKRDKAMEKAFKNLDID